MITAALYQCFPFGATLNSLSSKYWYSCQLINFHANISIQFSIHTHFVLLSIQNQIEKREIIKLTFLQIGFPLLLIFVLVYLTLPWLLTLQCNIKFQDVVHAENIHSSTFQFARLQLQYNRINLSAVDTIYLKRKQEWNYSYFIPDYSLTVFIIILGQILNHTFSNYVTL